MVHYNQYLKNLSKSDRTKVDLFFDSIKREMDAKKKAVRTLESTGPVTREMALAWCINEDYGYFAELSRITIVVV